MAITNTNKMMIDRPMWEQLSFFPSSAGVSGSSMCDDGVRYIYWMNSITSTTATFWRYDTWYDTWQLLATPPTTTIIIGTIKYVGQLGGQFSGRTYGSVYSFQGNGTTAYFYLYDIATNTWSTKSIANIPATFGTDVSIAYPEPEKNGNIGGYHSGVLRSITTTATVSASATTVTVSATSEAMPSGTRLKFGTSQITLTSAVSSGSNLLSVSATGIAIAAGTQLILPDGRVVTVSSAVSSGATSINIYPATFNISSGTIISVERYVVLSAAAASGATSLTIQPSMYSIESGAIAFYYGNMYLVGNNSTQMYRYNISTDTWSTTSANTSNPALVAVTGAVGAGCSIRWMPLYSADTLYILRGGNTSNAYTYNLSTNTISNEAFYQTAETFTTGTSVATRSTKGRQSSLLIGLNSTGRIFEGRPDLNTLEPKATQWLYPYSGAVVGDRMACLTSPDGVEFLYTIPHSTTALVRCAMIDT